VFERFAVAVEWVGGRHQAAEVGRPDESGSQVEGPGCGSVRQGLGAVGVCADQLDLAVPERGEFEGDRCRHADEHDASPGSGDREGIGDAGRRAHAVDDHVGATTEPIHGTVVTGEADGPAACGPPHRPADAVGFDDQVGAEFGGEPPLAGVTGGGDDGPGVRKGAGSELASG